MRVHDRDPKPLSRSPTRLRYTFRLVRAYGIALAGLPRRLMLAALQSRVLRPQRSRQRGSACMSRFGYGPASFPVTHLVCFGIEASAALVRRVINYMCVWQPVIRLPS